MNNYTVFHSPRRGGKTTWILRRVSEHLASGHRIAVVVPHEWLKRLIGSGVDVYCETTFPRARGCIYDYIYVDEANMFYDDPVEMCARIAPGVPATFTYTAYPFEGVDI